MNEKALGILIRRELLAGFVRYGVEGLQVKHGYQPTTQGRLDRCVYFWEADETPIGWQHRTRSLDPQSLQLRTSETQIQSTMFQVQAFSPDNINDMAQLTAKDLVRMARQIVQSQPFVIALTAQNVGMTQPSSLRNPYFVNEQDQFEANPSFDFTVTHKQVIIQLTDSIDSLEFNLRRV